MFSCWKSHDSQDILQIPMDLLLAPSAMFDQNNVVSDRYGTRRRRSRRSRRRNSTSNRYSNSNMQIES